MKKFYCIGDSITNGARNEFYRNYTLELNNLLKKKNYFFLNESINGQTTSEIVQRLIEIVFKEDLHGVIFIGGTNDTKVPIPINIFKKNLEIVIKICKSKKIKLYLATLPKIYSGLPMYSKDSGNIFIRNYNKIIKILSKKNKIPFANLYKMSEKLFSDGIHTNNTGCEYMARKFKKLIDRNEI
jgi:lysophospholipase L1-like esterase